MNNIPELKSGYRAELRDGTIGIFFIDKDNWCVVALTWWAESIDYNQNFKSKINNNYDIVKIYKAPSLHTDWINEDTKGDLIWQRESDVKEITVSELEEYFGCPIKIIKEVS